MIPDLALFLGLAAVAILASIAMIVSRNAVYSALFLVLNFLTVATLYLLLNAAFIAMVQVTVYAGAIMVLFLFVVMLLGTKEERINARMPWQGALAVLLGGVLLFIISYVIFGPGGAGRAQLSVLDQSFGSPASVGRLLFDQYLVPFEVTSVLLLVAMVGAIVLTHERRRRQS